MVRVVELFRRCFGAVHVVAVRPLGCAWCGAPAAHELCSTWCADQRDAYRHAMETDP